MHTIVEKLCTHEGLARLSRFKTRICFENLPLICDSQRKNQFYESLIITRAASSLVCGNCVLPKVLLNIHVFFSSCFS